ncbi:MAG: hypothetical protein ACC619_04070, partial [Paracoccaceae bacterium]
LVLTLDGDTVVGAAARSAVALDGDLVPIPLSPDEFVARLSAMLPLSRVAYGLLAVTALENAADISPAGDVARGRAAALERERIASHLSWLSEVGAQAGFGWLASRAAGLQLQVQGADAGRIATLAPAITALLRRAKAAPFLRMRLSGIGRLDQADAAGPVARAQSRAEDARDGDAIFGGLGFRPVTQDGGDALARFRQRCDEIGQSLRLIAGAGVITLPEPGNFPDVSGEGEAICETPRGAARLWLRLKAGRVEAAKLTTPSNRNLALIEELTAEQELGDALVAVASLDISPWEITVRTGAGHHP